MPTYLFRCKICGRTLEERHPVSNIPAGTPCQCGANAARTFTTQVIIQSCPLSLHDQQERDYIGHINQLTHAERERLDQRQEQYLKRLSDQPVRPSFDTCLDEARRELTAKRVNYQQPTVPG